MEEANRLGLCLLSGDPAVFIGFSFSYCKQFPRSVQDLTRSLRMKFDEGLEKALWREADCQAHSYATTMGEGWIV